MHARTHTRTHMCTHSCLYSAVRSFLQEARNKFNARTHAHAHTQRHTYSSSLFISKILSRSYRRTLERMHKCTHARTHARVPSVSRRFFPMNNKTEDIQMLTGAQACTNTHASILVTHTNTLVLVHVLSKRRQTHAHKRIHTHASPDSPFRRSFTRSNSGERCLPA